MKKIQKLVVIIFTLFSILSISYAHSGRTDSEGGHYDRSTGEYHYHHGYSAHNHTDGICPYDYDDRTSHTTNKNSDKESSWEKYIKERNITRNTATKNTTTIKKSANTTETNSNNTTDFSGLLAIGGLWGGTIALYKGYDFIVFLRNKKKKKILALPEAKQQPVRNKAQPIPLKSSYKNVCPKCNARLLVRNGRYGKFYGCSNYPKCKFTKNYNKKIK